ncbi:MAG: flavodoxin family protein [Firmicutes bacterium]|nr:flavodoxin family protein [Bacillota bacterium]
MKDKEIKKVCILRGSPRKEGNTNALAEPFTAALKEKGCSVTEFDLYDMDLKPCLACRGCQQDWSVSACVREDDMYLIFDAVMRSDLIVIASPIYSWYCTAPTKMVLDRLVYGLNKYYGDKKGPSLWAGKQVALLTTCGYKPEKGADLWEEGMKRYCRHSQLEYRGMLAERHLGYNTVFMDDEKAERARTFAEGLFNE